MTSKIHTRYLLIKLAIFTTLAAFVLIYREKLVENLQPFIGSLMIFYGLEGILYEVLCHRLHFIHSGKSYLGLIELIFGTVLLVAPLEFAYVCVIWATWSIVRESYEIKEIISDIKTIPPKILSGVESIAVIVLSIMLILEPGEHHALIHMYMLVIELILNPATVLLDELLIYLKEKKKPQVEEEQKKDQ